MVGVAAFLKGLKEGAGAHFAESASCASGAWRWASRAGSFGAVPKASPPAGSSLY